jgi:hypothetical protein
VKEFKVRPILHAGEGPVDMSARALEEVLGCRTPEEAAELVVPGMVAADGGQPTFDDAGTDFLVYHLCVEDAAGKRTSYLATARLKIDVTLEEIPTP